MNSVNMNISYRWFLYKNVFLKCKCRINHVCIHEEEDWNNFQRTTPPTWKKVHNFFLFRERHVYRPDLRCYEKCPFCTQSCRSLFCPNYPAHPLYSCQNSTSNKIFNDRDLSCDQQVHPTPEPQQQHQRLKIAFFQPRKVTASVSYFALSSRKK